VRLTEHNNIKELLIYRKKPCNFRYNNKVKDYNKVRVWYNKDNVLKDKDLQIETSYCKKKRDTGLLTNREVKGFVDNARVSILFNSIL
jgi:hypothetical protein